MRLLLLQLLASISLPASRDSRAALQRHFWRSSRQLQPAGTFKGLKDIGTTVILLVVALGTYGNRLPVIRRVEAFERVVIHPSIHTLPSPSQQRSASTPDPASHHASTGQHTSAQHSTAQRLTQYLERPPSVRRTAPFERYWDATADHHHLHRGALTAKQTRGLPDSARTSPIFLARRLSGLLFLLLFLPHQPLFCHSTRPARHLTHRLVSPSLHRRPILVRTVSQSARTYSRVRTSQLQNTHPIPYILQYCTDGGVSIAHFPSRFCLLHTSHLRRHSTFFSRQRIDATPR